MRTTIALLMAGCLLAATGVAQAASSTPAEQLAKATAGRVEGKPVDCLMLRDIDSSQIINGTAIVYKMLGGTVYVNTPKAGADSLRSDSIMVTDTHSPQLCGIDTVKLYQSGSRMLTGTVFLGKFIPYEKPRS